MILSIHVNAYSCQYYPRASTALVTVSKLVYLTLPPSIPQIYNYNSFHCYFLNFLPHRRQHTEAIAIYLTDYF